MSPKAAGLAAKMGYGNIKVYLKGDPGWVKDGNTLTSSDSFVNTGNIVLVDLRSADEAAKGHIKGAVNIPMAQLAQAEEKFPAKKSAPIVLYGNGQDAATAARTVSGWGYKTVALVNGGIEKFAARGNQLVTGPTSTEIKWVRKLGKEEVALSDFLKAAEGMPGQVILDVRTKDEVKSGMFHNAVNIPLDELGKRAVELPQDKEILVHCTTGARAQMALGPLAKAGLKARFLMATVECEGGKCQAAD